MRHTQYLRLGIVILGFSLGSAPAAADTAVVVSARSSVVTLTRNQVTDIFLGKTGAFPNGDPALPIDQAEGSPARDEFYLKFAAKTPALLKAYWSKIIFTGRGRPPIEAPNDAAVKKYLLEHPNAIGYIDKGALDGSVRALPIQ